MPRFASIIGNSCTNLSAKTGGPQSSTASGPAHSVATFSTTSSMVGSDRVGAHTMRGAGAAMRVEHAIRGHERQQRDNREGDVLHAHGA